MSSPIHNKLPLLLILAFVVLVIAMSPLFAEEANAGIVTSGPWYCEGGTSSVAKTCQMFGAGGQTNFCKTCTDGGGVCKKSNAPDGTCTPTVAEKAVKSAGDIIGGAKSWLFDISVGFVLKFLNYLLYGISTVLERLVALSAFLLEMAIDVSSAPFSDLTILKDGWKIVRNVMNSFFVLFLFIIAIATILQLESYAWKALLPTFIIVALLVNFSFVLSGVVIDFSNVLGRTFFDKLNSPPNKLSGNIAKAFDINNINNITLPTCSPSVTSGGGTVATITSHAKGWSCAAGATKSVESMVVAWDTIFNTPSSETDKLTKFLFVLTLRVIMLFLMIFPLLAGAALMIIRTITLMVLIIFAPAAFTAYILPATRQYATQWWSELFSKSFFFPAYLFILYIAVQYGIKIGKALKETGQLGGTFENLATIFNFLTMVAFMFLALDVGRKSGIKGADVVMKYADTARKWAQGYAGRKATRMTGIPRGLEKLAESGAAQRFAARFPTLGGATLRTLQKGATLGGREAVIKREVDTAMGLAPRYQATAYLKASAPVRRRLEEQMKAEGMAEMMHFTDDQKTRQKIRDSAFAYLPPEQRENAKRKLGDAYADREGNKQSIGQLKGRFNNPAYYSEAEKESIVDEMKTERRARLIAVADDVGKVEGMIEKVLGNNARELDKTREEIARYGISLPSNQFLPYFNKLSNETKRRVFDIINPRELERQMAEFGISAPGATPAQAAEKTANEAAFLSTLQPLGRNRSNIEIRKIAGAVRPKFYSELGYGNQEELVRALTPAEAASMNEEDMKDAAISQHFEGGQLEAVARSQRVSPETRRQVRDNVIAYSDSQTTNLSNERASLGSQLLGGQISQVDHDREIDRIDRDVERIVRLRIYLNRSSAYQ